MRAKARNPWADTIIRPSAPQNGEATFLWRRGNVCVETVHHPTHGLRFAIREGGRTSYQKTYRTWRPPGWLEAYARTGAVRLPSCAEPRDSLDALAQRMRDFVHRHFDCDPRFESVAVLYILHTWVYEVFHAVPYLRFIGLSNTGKTRATETIGVLCYRPLVIAGAATPAPMYRLIEPLGGTLLLDEADFRDSQIGADIVKILNCGYQRGLPVIRMDKTDNGQFVPAVYQVFGPKILNGRSRYNDDATENRCLSYTPAATTRPDIPAQLPSSFEDEARQIRNQALAWRFDNLNAFSLDALTIPGLSGRSQQLVLPLAAVAERLSDERYRRDLLAFAGARDEEAREDRRESAEGMLVEAFVEHAGPESPTCGNLVDAVLNSGHDPRLQRWLSPKRAGAILRTLGFTTRHAKRGNEVFIEPGRLQTLAARFGVATGEHSPQR